MKKTIRMVGAMLLLALTPAIVSCGSDDDEPGNGSTNGGLNNGGSGDIETVEGLKLTSINNVTFSYDSKGRVDGFHSAYDNVTIDYNSGTIVMSDDDVMGEMKIKFTGKGYISELSQSWNYSDYEESYKGSGKATFSYDGSGHLTKISSKSNETYKDEDGSGKYSEEVTYTFNWKNGNLVSSKCVWKENDEGEIDSDTETYTLTYSNMSNPFRQVTFAVYDYLIDSEEWAFLGCAGLLGVGSENLPDDLTYYDEYDGEEHFYNLSYSLNNDGTISSERMGNSSYNYGYDYLGVRSNSGNELGLKNFKLFRTHKDRRTLKK